MDGPKKQHWVPRFYLEQFAIMETRGSKIPKVWSFSKEHHDPKEPVKVSILDAASSRYMYSPIDGQGNRDFSTEKKLARLEGLVAQIWPDICSDSIAFSGSVRKIMGLFLATIMLRDQKSLNTIKKIHNKLHLFFDRLPKDDLGKPQIKKLFYKGKEFDVDLSDWQNFKNGSDNYIKQIFVNTVNKDVMQIAKILLDKAWSIRIFSKPILATSDVPFIMCNTTSKLSHF